MASGKNAKNPYQWPDGTWHSTTWVTHQQNLAAAAVKDKGPGAQLIAAGDAYYKTTGIPNPNAAAATAPTPPQPVDPALESARLIGNRNVAIGKGNAAYDTGNLGFDAGYNPDGTPNMANPYSRAALLMLDHEHQRAGTMNSLAAAGQYNTGAYGRAQNRNDRNYAMGEAANRLGYQRGIHSIQTGQLNTFANAGTGVSDTDFQALLRATYPGS